MLASGVLAATTSKVIVRDFGAYLIAWSEAPVECLDVKHTDLFGFWATKRRVLTSIPAVEASTARPETSTPAKFLGAAELRAQRGYSLALELCRFAQNDGGDPTWAEGDLHLPIASPAASSRAG